MTKTTKPLIGVLTRSDAVDVKQALPCYSVLQQYVKVLCRFGAAVTLIPPQGSEGLKSCYDSIDGLLLAGGTDLSMGLSEANTEGTDIDSERDRAEFQVASMALENDIPVLGICRGMQLLNVVSGGSICHDIFSAIPGALKHTSDWRSNERNLHDIEIVPGTMLYSLAGDRTRIQVNGNHHQCVQRLSSHMKRSATAPDGVVEAIECPSRRYVLGVQWHPEWLVEEGESLSERIFSSFVGAAQSRAR